MGAILIHIVKYQVILLKNKFGPLCCVEALLVFEGQVVSLGPALQAEEFCWIFGLNYSRMNLQ